MSGVYSPYLPLFVSGTIAASDYVPNNRFLYHPPLHPSEMAYHLKFGGYEKYVKPPLDVSQLKMVSGSEFLSARPHDKEEVCKRTQGLNHPTQEERGVGEVGT